MEAIILLEKVLMKITEYRCSISHYDSDLGITISENNFEIIKSHFCSILSVEKQDSMNDFKLYGCSLYPSKHISDSTILISKIITL